MTRASRWDASFGAQLRNTTRGMHLASGMRVHRVAWLVLWSACGSEAPICELEPPSWDAATEVRVQVRGPDHGARPVFVQDAEGLLLFEGVTAADGSLVVGDIPANAFLTVDVADDFPDVRVVSYVGVQSGETIVVGPSFDYTDTGGAAEVTVRFPQLDLPTTASYDVDFGRHCANQDVIEHVPTPGTVQSIVLTPRCPGPAGFVTVVASDTDGQYFGAAGAALEEVPATGALTVEVGPWNTEMSSVEVTTTRPPREVTVLPEHDGYLRAIRGSNRTVGPLPVPVASDVIDATLIGILFDDQNYTVRTTAASPLIITDDDLLPPIEAVDADSPGDSAMSVAWHYTGPVTAVIATYFINVGDRLRLSRKVVLHDPGGCSISLPPLPPRSRYRIPERGGVDLFEAGSIDVIYSPELSRDAVHKLVADDYDLPLDVPVHTVEKFYEIRSIDAD